ncbi:phosphatase PAP2 family protein [Bergeyella sp. RCAD1439]|uniref:phosphatase PAP2 family protein n=1 Tax=Bergeyella anatis TaxID=3113737 RepID=UPI002E172A61|nr:phosphatase PAP2 family protein [Bergeyella sp. RCAD1439]
MKNLFKRSSIIWLPLTAYFLLVAGIVAWKDPQLLLSPSIMGNRALFLGIFGFSFALHQRVSYRLWALLTVLLAYAALSVLYKETALLNRLFLPSVDPMLMAWDEKIFGEQPALVFSQVLSHPFFSEMMYFGYFAYYLMPVVLLFYLYRYRPGLLESFGFLVIASFLSYYVFFIFVPAFGPQFFFPFPENQIQAHGIFGRIIKLIQQNGEAPTAAFPSSHVAVAVIILLWVWTHKREWLFYFLPVVVLLMFSTVYIKAHYFVDVVGGLASAPVVYYGLTRLLKGLRKNEY